MLKQMDDQSVGDSDRRPVNGGRRSFTRLAAAQGADTDPAEPNPRPLAAAAPESGKVLYQNACLYLEQVFRAVRSQQRFDLEPGLRIVEQMIHVPPAQDLLFSLSLHLDDPMKYAAFHSVNVAVYAARIAKHLGFEPRRQVEIGLAGLMHDVGMALVPEAIIYKRSPLDAQDLKVLKNRPNLAEKILQGFGLDFAYLAECAAQVSERIDGSGYPRGLKSDEIHEYAQVLGLLDLYEALVHSRPNRDRFSFFEAVKYIFKSSKNQFQRRHMKALLGLFTVFPIHSYVLLNSEAVGKVIETYPDQPMRPKLKILFDSQRRNVLTTRIVSLQSASLLNVVACITEKEIRELKRGGAAAPSPVPENCPVDLEPVL
jgi:HD-GYP domain-containing protein (c-di-GMP phosphodiesterase class II)